MCKFALTRRRFLGVVLGSMASGAVRSSSVRADPEAPESVLLEAQVVECDAEIYLNGIPVALLAASPGSRLPDAGPRLALSVNQYMVDGVNELAVILQPGASPSSRVEGQKVPRSASASFLATLKRYRTGSLPSESIGKQLLELRWSPQEGGSAASDRKSKSAELGSMYGPWVWQSATNITIGPEVKDEVAGVLRTVAEGFARGDAEPFIELARERFHEINRAYGRPTDYGMDQLREKIKERASQTSWAMAPIDPDQFDLRSCAAGRMIDCLTRDWKPILRQREGPNGLSTMFWPVRLGKMGGQWKILR